jgi:DNA-binding winged helix-turn-helix (wHTH) protein/tetratricopeptide (TPR) repeat protein
MTDELRSVPRAIHFGTFEVDPRSRELRRKGVRVALQDQPFSLLLTLLERAGELVTREELRHRLWSDDTFVDFEHGLNTAVKRLRDALGDSAVNPRFVETVPRRGYRFIAPLVHVDTTRPQPGRTPDERESRERHAALPRGGVAPPDRSRQHRLGLVVASLLGLLFMGGLVERAISLLGRHGADEAAAANAVSRGALGSHRVAVSTFENGTGRAALDPLAGLIAGRLLQALAQVKRVAVDSTTARGRDASWHEPARRPALVVTGAYYLHGDQLEVQVRFLDGATGRLLHAVAATDIGPPGAPEGLDSLDDLVAGAVATHFDEFFGGLDVVSRVPGLKAYNDYRAGLELFQSDYPRAMEHLTRAIASAPGHLPAEVVLLFAHTNQQQHERVGALIAQWADSWDRLGPAERLLVEAMKHVNAGRSGDSVRALRHLERLVPSSLLVQFNLAQQLLQANQPRAAREVFARLEFDDRELRHSIGLYRHIGLGTSLHMLGEYEEELQVARRAQEQHPSSPSLKVVIVRALAALGRVDEAVGEALEIRSVALDRPFVISTPNSLFLPDLRRHLRVTD